MADSDGNEHRLHLTGHAGGLQFLVASSRLRDFRFVPKAGVAVS